MHRTSEEGIIIQISIFFLKNATAKKVPRNKSHFLINPIKNFFLPFLVMNLKIADIETISIHKDVSKKIIRKIGMIEELTDQLNFCAIKIKIIISKNSAINIYPIFLIFFIMNISSNPIKNYLV